MIFLLDNYDSFTFNLYQYIAELGRELSDGSDSIRVERNDQITVGEILEMRPDHIVISPGPGRPERAGIAIELIRKCAGRIPILGVCLGHQAIGVAFGFRLGPAKRLMHGKVSEIGHDGKSIFSGLPDPFVAVRYHSLALAGKPLPDCFEVTCRSEDGEVMGIRHREYLLEGVQFHPESILTPEGKGLLRNFLRISPSE